MTVSSQRLQEDHVSLLMQAFAQVGWPKGAKLFEGYKRDVEEEKRVVWVAFLREQVAGYVTLLWDSRYPPFKEQGIPEIVDLNVLPKARGRGVGSYLLALAEKEAFSKSPWVGLGVGLYAGIDGGYGAAQRLYIKREYVPDGLGVTYSYKPVVPGKSYPIDDDLVLWLLKDASAPVSNDPV